MSWPVTASRRLASMASNRWKPSDLYSLSGIALAVAAEVDHLAQVLERDEMLAPEVVQRLQQDHLLDLPHRLGAELGLFRLGLLLDRLQQPLA